MDLALILRPLFNDQRFPNLYGYLKKPTLIFGVHFLSEPRVVNRTIKIGFVDFRLHGESRTRGVFRFLQLEPNLFRQYTTFGGSRCGSPHMHTFWALFLCFSELWRKTGSFTAYSRAQRRAWALGDRLWRRKTIQ